MKRRINLLQIPGEDARTAHAIGDRRQIIEVAPRLVGDAVHHHIRALRGFRDPLVDGLLLRRGRRIIEPPVRMQRNDRCFTLDETRCRFEGLGNGGEARGANAAKRFDVGTSRLVHFGHGRAGEMNRVIARRGVRNQRQEEVRIMELLDGEYLLDHRARFRHRGTHRAAAVHDDDMVTDLLFDLRFRYVDFLRQNVTDRRSCEVGQRKLEFHMSSGSGALFIRPTGVTVKWQSRQTDRIPPKRRIPQRRSASRSASDASYPTLRWTECSSSGVPP